MVCYYVLKMLTFQAFPGRTKALEVLKNELLWSGSHTSYELYSLSKIIIYKFLLNFNGNI